MEKPRDSARITENDWDLENKTNVDLSKAFDSLNHELLSAKLRWYGLDQNAVEFFKSYLSNCYQCCKINNTLGDYRNIIAGV